MEARLTRKGAKSRDLHRTLGSARRRILPFRKVPAYHGPEIPTNRSQPFPRKLSVLMPVHQRQANKHTIAN
jgi:hypothetical protein